MVTPQNSLQAGVYLMNEEKNIEGYCYNNNNNIPLLNNRSSLKKLYVLCRLVFLYCMRRRIFCLFFDLFFLFCFVLFCLFFFCFFCFFFVFFCFILFYFFVFFWFFSPFYLLVFSFAV